MVFYYKLQNKRKVFNLVVVDEWLVLSLNVDDAILFEYGMSSVLEEQIYTPEYVIRC